VPVILLAHNTSQKHLFSAILVAYKFMRSQMSIDELVLHDDYEYFASYLGVEYDDYVELVGDFELSDDGIEIEYALSI
jgi:hypothetical protein